LFIGFSMTAVDYAEARRGGSFGSRGTRTFQAPPATRTAPQPTAPVERSMSPRQQTSPQAAQPRAAQPRPTTGLFASPLARGLLLGGLFGLLMGYGFGGLAGLFGLLFQLLLIGGAIFLLMRLFRSSPAGREPAMAGGPQGVPRDRFDSPRPGSFTIPRVGAAGAPAAAAASDVRLTQTDLDTFERQLREVQEAFGREDHAALRRLATPEMVSYLSEELADNAKNGVRNEVSDMRLLQADIAESWREGDRDYATAAMLYESRDVTVDRGSGAVVSGDPERPTETTELWTFMRERGGDWKLSAIQDARG
jgi:predicted lipid-binding transport protein (Tim44 family)